MSVISTIKNEFLEVSVSSFGAELKSIKTSDGAERLWQGDPDVWEGQAPVLFPIVSRLRGGKYTFDGKEYSLPMHGFASKSEFALVDETEDELTYSLVSSEETKKVYPFDFAFFVTYRLVGAAIDIIFRIENPSDIDSFVSCGSHEGYACPGGIENYSIIFDEVEPCLKARGLDAALGTLSDEDTVILEDDNILPLKNSYFEIDALIFLNLRSRGVALLNNETGDRLHVDFNGADTLLIWTQPGAEYVCIEPWCGMPEFTSYENYDITKKRGIMRLAPKCSIVRKHTISFPEDE